MVSDRGTASITVSGVLQYASVRVSLTITSTWNDGQSVPFGDQKFAKYTSHPQSEDTFKGLGALSTRNPIVVDILGICGIIPWPRSKEIPFDRRASHHRFLMTRSHYDSPPVGQRLVLRIVDVECTVVKAVTCDCQTTMVNVKLTCSKLLPTYVRVSHKSGSTTSQCHTWPQVIAFQTQDQLEPVTLIRHGRRIALWHIQLSIEQVIERGTCQCGPSSVGEFFHSPVLQGRLFVIQKDAPVLDCGRAMETTWGCDENVGMLGRGDIRPPTRSKSIQQPRTQPHRERTSTKVRHLRKLDT